MLNHCWSHANNPSSTGNAPRSGSEWSSLASAGSPEVVPEPTRQGLANTHNLGGGRPDSAVDLAVDSSPRTDTVGHSDITESATKKAAPSHAIGAEPTCGGRRRGTRIPDLCGARRRALVQF